MTPRLHILSGLFLASILTACGGEQPTSDTPDMCASCVVEPDMSAPIAREDMSVIAPTPAREVLIAPGKAVHVTEHGEAPDALFISGSTRLELRGGELQAGTHRGQLEDRELLAAAQLPDGDWLISSQRGLELLGEEGLISSPIAPYFAQSRPTAIAVEPTATGYNLWSSTINGVFVWSNEQLSRVDDASLPANARVLIDAEGSAWAWNEQALRRLTLTDEDVEVTTVIERDGIDAVVASATGLWMLSAGELFTRSSAGAWQKLNVDATPTAIFANSAADGVWFSADGKLWHVARGVLEALDLDAPARAWVDEHGRLLLARDQRLTAHDRELRVSVDAMPAQPIIEPTEVSFEVTFPELLDAVTARVGTTEFVPTQLADEPTRYTLSLDPSSLGPAAHELTITATWQDVEPAASAATSFAVETGELSWQTHIRPLYSQYCAACHKVTDKKPLDTRESWESDITSILAWVTPGEMPPGDLPKLTDAQVELIVRWSDQNYPE